MLTLLRFFVSPFALPLLLVYLLPYNSLFINSTLALLFVALSLTVFFDGFFVRKFGYMTKLGEQLDPLANQFLSYAALVSLLAAGKIFFYWVIILIGSDFFVMGLRAVARQNNVTLTASFFGKMKRTAQLVFLAFLILNPYQGAGFSNTWNIIENGLLVLLLVLSVLSVKSSYDKFKKEYGPLESLLGEAKKTEQQQGWFEERPPES